MATLRVEFYPIAGGMQADPFASQTIVVTGTPLSGAGLITAPTGVGNLLAVFTAIDAAIYVDLGDGAADAGTEPRRLVRPGVRLDTACGAGWKVSAATAADIPAVSAGSSSVVVNATATDRSGTITAGGTAQVLMPANANRRGYWVQNLSTGDLWINGQGTAAASQPSLKLISGAYYETPVLHVGPGAVSIFGATTAQAFSAREY